MASRLRQDPDVQRSITEQRKRERELRLAKRQALRQGDRAKAFELGEYGRQNGIDQRGVRRSEQVQADAQASVAGGRRDLALMSRINDQTARAQLLEANNRVGAAKQVAATANPNARPTKGDQTSVKTGTPGVSTSQVAGSALALGPHQSNLATPDQHKQAEAIAREAMAGGGEFGPTAFGGAGVGGPGSDYWSNPVRSTDTGPSAKLVPSVSASVSKPAAQSALATPKAPAEVQTGGAPSRSQLLAAGKVTQPDGTVAPRQTEKIVAPGEEAPAGYVLVGMSKGNRIYRNDEETLDAEASAKQQTQDNSAKAAERDRLGRTPAEKRALESAAITGDFNRVRAAERLGDRIRAGERPELDHMDPSSRKALLAREAQVQKSQDAERRRTMSPEQRYQDDTAKRAAKFDAEFGTSGNDDITALKAQRDGGGLSDEDYASVEDKIKKLTARELFVKYDIDTPKRLRSTSK